jgi:hypothetical protein
VVSVGLSIPIGLLILHRSLSQILILDHKVFLSSTTAASIMPKKSGSLSKIKHVSNKSCILDNHWLFLVCKLVILLPYSPDLNPIEQAFASIKAFLCCHWRDSCLSLIDCVCHNITPDKAWGYFQASGYVV